MRLPILSCNKLACLCCFSCLVLTGWSQKVNSLYFLDRTPIHARLNPAMSPTSSGFGIGLSNLTLDFRSDLAFDDLFYPGEDGTLHSFAHPDADKQAFLQQLDDVSNLRGNLNMELFSVGVKLKNFYFSFHNGLNIDMGMGVPKDFFNLMLLGMSESQTASTQFDFTRLNTNILTYSKTGVGMAMKIGNMFQIGANVDYLLGIGQIKMGFKQMTIDASSTAWNIRSQGYLQYAGPDQIQFTYSEDHYLDGLESDFNSVSLGSASIAQEMSPAGNGVSVDLGVTAKPLPFLTLSASVTDLGSIKWKKDMIQRAASNADFVYDGVKWEESSGDDGEDPAELLQDEWDDLVHFEKEQITKGYSTPLTTKLNLGAEAAFLNNHISLGVLSQTSFAETDTYQDLMMAVNLKPGSAFQAALTYSLLNGSWNSYGVALNAKLLFLNLYLAADYIPGKFSPQMIPVNTSNVNLQFGINFLF